MTKEDMALHAGLMKLLDEATFPLRAREAKAFLVVYDWAKRLPEKLNTQPKIEKVKRGSK